MLDKFIICICEGDLSVLVIEGSPPASALTEAWQKIYDEYADALYTKEQRKARLETKEITLLQQRILAIHMCLFRLSVTHSEDIVKELRKWITVRETFDPTNPETYEKDIQSVLNRCKSRYEIDLKQRLREIEATQSQQPVTIDKWYFERCMVQLQKHMGTPINKFQTTVSSFAFMMADLIRKGEELDRQMSKS